MNKKELSEAARILGRAGGLAKSKKKAEAVKKNGRQGGRPRQWEYLVTIGEHTFSFSSRQDRANFIRDKVVPKGLKYSTSKKEIQ